MLDRSQESVDLDRKRKDIEHLLFHPDGSRRILRFPEFVASLAP